jgi:hypothetical protein
MSIAIRVSKGEPNLILPAFLVLGISIIFIGFSYNRPLIRVLPMGVNVLTATAIGFLVGANMIIEGVIFTVLGFFIIHYLPIEIIEQQKTEKIKKGKK